MKKWKAEVNEVGVWEFSVQNEEDKEAKKRAEEKREEKEKKDVHSDDEER